MIKRFAERKSTYLVFHDDKQCPDILERYKDTLDQPRKELLNAKGRISETE